MPVILGPTVVSQSTYSAERSTYLEIKADLAREFNDSDATTLALAGDALNDSIRHYNRMCWPWEVLSQDITLVSGTATYALNQPFKRELAAYRLISSRPHSRLQYLPFSDFINRYQTDLDGTPVAYTLENQFETGQITIFPRPATADSIRIWYYRHTPTMRTDEATLEVPAYAEGAYRLMARYELLKRLGGADQASKMGLARADAFQARAELIAMCVNSEDTY